jgi:beta-phosphoglucomutase-like phosphatase (HAD superfamily)
VVPRERCGHQESKGEHGQGAADLIATAAATGRAVVMVSNNSSYAILEYLAIHRIGPVAGVVGRDDSDPELMKPSPYLVRAAVGILDAHPAECALVGDSTTDMLAGAWRAFQSSAMRTGPARPNC